MWPGMPGGSRAGMPEDAAQDTRLCLGAEFRAVLPLHSETIGGAQWKFLELSGFQVLPKLLGSQAWWQRVSRCANPGSLCHPCL